MTKRILFRIWVLELIWDLVLAALGRLCGLGDQSGAEASRADLHAHRPSLLDRLHLVEVGIPNLSGFVISVAHIVTKDRSFSANITHFRHGRTSIKFP